MVAADLDALSGQAARETLRLLARYRREIVAMLAEAEGSLATGYRRLLREIDQLAASYRGQLALPVITAVTSAAEAGDADVLRDLGLSRMDVLSYSGVNPVLVKVAGEYVADLTEKLVADINQKVSMHIRLAALGGIPFQTLMDRIGRDMTTGTFKPAKGRIETIAQTEVSRLYNMAYFDQATELSRRYEGMMKVWVHAASSPGFTKVQRERSRENHMRVARETAENPIPMDALFDLGGEKTARYPHDPALPASETSRCRCRLRIVTPEPEG
jgi:hypothetical protein